MDNPAKLYQTAKGPIVIVGNGPSLADIPDAFLQKYPTFGCNAIHLRRGFTPTYWAAADDWVLDFWPEIVERYGDAPKFVLDSLSVSPAPALLRWHRKQGPVWIDQRNLSRGYLQDPGISFRGITHAMIQIALFMGYNKFYLVGCDNTDKAEHFYQERLNDYVIDVDLWEWAFDTLQTCLIPKPIINLSTRGHIPCLPWADWKNL